MRNPFVLRSRLHAAEKTLPPLQKELQKLGGNNLKLKQRNDALKSEVRVLHGRINELQARVDHLQNAAGFSHLVMTGPHTACVQLLTGQKFFVDTADSSVGLPIAFDRNWEPYLVGLFLRELQQDSFFIDVGANCGFFSVVAATKIKTGFILAVEPNPHLCGLINKSLFINAIWPYARCLNMAVTDHDGEVTLNFDPELVGGGGLSPYAPVDPAVTNHPPLAHHSVVVPGRTLDAIVAAQKLQRVDFVKIDVEAWEPMVFQGMSATLAANPQLKLLLEFSHSAYADAPGFFKKLQAAFSTVAQVMQDGSLVPLRDYDHFTNTLWAPWGNLFCRNL